MPFENGKMYNDGNPSIGHQMVDFYYYKKALMDSVNQRFFGQMSSVINMPKHFGQTIKQYYYLPVLDDRNVNDQGIDATGATVTDEVTIFITDPAGYQRYAVGQGADAATALTAAQAKAVDIFKNIGAYATSYAATVAALTAAGWEIVEGDAVNNGGNLYASSRDVGAVVGKMPAIGENGGRFNRIGHKRIEVIGTIENFGFFHEYTEDSIQFDNDSELMEHITREALTAANDIVEDQLQIDLLNGAGIVYYGGDATSMSELTGETGETPSVLDYETLIRIEAALNNKKCPKDTTIITGSRMVDTRTVGSTRYAFTGPELKRSLLKMKDYHDERAYIPIEKYGAAGTIAAGEIGTVAGFHIIENQQMMHFAGQGAPVTNNDGYMEENGRYNVYPFLVVGGNSFINIGFQTDGKNVKFKIIHKKPGEDMAGREDPYGKNGFWSIQWWSGVLIQRPTWIACVKVVAER